MAKYTPIPDNFQLDQAYPNPFNPITTVQFEIPIDVDMTLAVYDIQGRLVTYLSKGFMSAGYYESVWDASRHSSGLYFIHLKAIDSDHSIQFNELQKIMLVK